MKKLFVLILLALSLSGCSYLSQPIVGVENLYLRVLSERGRPDSIFDDYLNNRRVLMYYGDAYVFRLDDMKLIEIKTNASIAFLYKVEPNK
jgi:hypothetical protein